MEKKTLTAGSIRRLCEAEQKSLKGEEIVVQVTKVEHFNTSGKEQKKNALRVKYLLSDGVA